MLPASLVESLMLQLIAEEQLEEEETTSKSIEDRAE
jgi:hypothetical protein